jgi:hypothetical protein
MIPIVVENFKHYEMSTCDKGKRFRYLQNILARGIDEYIRTVTLLFPDFYDFGEPSYLVDFEKSNELAEWIISGFNKRNQDELFRLPSESEEDKIDSP